MTEPTRTDIAASQSPVHEPLLTVVTDPTGAIGRVDGSWLGQPVLHAGNLTDFLHPDDHDLIERVLGWLRRAGDASHAVNVHVRSGDGWTPAALRATRVDPGVVWHVIPLIPDPLWAAVEAVAAGRDLATALESALQGFAEMSDSIWATVHYGRTPDDRYGSVVATTGRDTFRRAIENAAAADRRCPWDTDLDGMGMRLGLSDFGDGIRLAAPRAGVTACDLLPVQSAAESDAACLVVWSELAEQLDSPHVHALCDRVLAAMSLAFGVAETRAEAHALATTDPLTGLLNRQAFLKALDAPGARRRCALASIDVDGFRTINAGHGNVVGDELLRQLASRLAGVMRPGDIVARVSSDEFALLCGDVANDDTAQQIAQRIVDVCDQPYQVRTGSVHITVSVGMAVSQPDQTASQLFEAAQHLMLAAKEDPKPGWVPAD